MEKINSEVKGLQLQLTVLQYHPPLREVRTETQAGQQPKEGADPETMEECCLLLLLMACSPCMAHRELGLPTSIINQENPQAKLVGAISQPRFPLLK